MDVNQSLFLVNYRGSLGYGQDSIYSLPGNVGTQDVRDVQVKTAIIIIDNVMVIANLKQVIRFLLGIVHLKICYC